MTCLMSKRSSRLGFKTIVCLAVLTANASLVPAAFSEEAVELEMITVTGEKIERTQQETTAATTVFTEDDLKESSATSLIELTESIPNTTEGANGGILNIRGVDGAGAGVSSFAYITAARARVSTMVDGVAQVWGGANLLDNGVWDAKQIEVLRGPQSTAQGRSAMSGAVIMSTNDPSFENEANIRLGAEVANGNYKYVAAGAVSGPITDDLAYRLSGSLVTGETFIDYIDDSDVMDYQTNPDALQNVDVKAKLLWQPSALPELSTRFDVQYKTQEGGYLNSVLLDRDDYEAPMSEVNHRIGESESISFVSNTKYEISPEVVASVVASYTDTTLGWYHHQETWNQMMDDWDQANYSLETRLNFASDDSPLTAMVGTSAIYDDQSLNIVEVAINTTEQTDTTFIGDNSTLTLSVFGEAEYAVTDKFNVIAGGRIERESQKRTASWYAQTDVLNDTESDNTVYLPKLGVTYDVLESTTLGLTFSRGYTPGGQSFERDNDYQYYEYDAEYVSSVELSLHSLLLDNRAAVNVNAFYNDYDDYQAFSYNTVFPDGNTGAGIVNVDKAISYGIELDATALVTDSTEVFVTASFMDTEVSKYTTDTTVEGNELPYAADITASIGFNQKIGESWSVGASAKYISDYYDSVDNDEEGDVVGDYALVNADVAYKWNDLGIRLYADNLFDEYVVLKREAGWAPTQEVGEPLTVGLTLDYAF